MRTARIALPLILLIIACSIKQPAVAQSTDTARARGKNGVAKPNKGDDVNHEMNHQAQPVSIPIEVMPTKEVRRFEEKPTLSAGENGDQVKLAVDLVVLDALVLQQKTARVVGNLKKEDFALQEDGVRQQITHFSQDTLPLSVILLIDRGGCLDPFGDKVRHATLEALERLKPQDEVALMAFHNTCELVSGFSRNKGRIQDALARVPPHDEEAEHCFNRAFNDAAEYMRSAGNPDGRRVIIVITALTTSLDCSGPSGEQARLAILESGSVLCGIIPQSTGQRMESGAMRAITGIAGIFKARSLNIKKLADETGGEVLSDKPEFLDRTFHQLMEHLRTRYSLGFVSTNAKRDGSFRKLKLELSESTQKSQGKLVVKTRRGYVAARAQASKGEKSQSN